MKTKNVLLAIIGVWCIVLSMMSATAQVNIVSPKNNTNTSNTTITLALNATGLLDQGNCYLKKMDADNASDKTIIDTQTTGTTGRKLFDYIGYWDLNKNPDDHSGNGNDATPYWMNNATGILGGAYEFDGQNSWMDMGDISPETFTIAFWAKPGQGSHNRFVMGEWSEGSQNGWKIQYFNASGQSAYELHIGNDSGTEGINTYNDARQDEWAFIAFTYNNTKARARSYLNGELELSGYLYQHIKIPVNNFQVGTTPLTGQFWNGTIDEIKFYNYTLTRAQIRKLYERRYHFYLDNKDNYNIYAPTLNGTITGNPQIVEGRRGCEKAMKFDGTDDRVETTPIFNGSKEATISAWVKLGINPDDGGTGANLIAGNDFNKGAIYFSETTNEILCNYRDTADTDIYARTNFDDEADQDWHHWVCTTNGTDIFLYKDGVQQDTTPGLNGELDSRTEPYFSIGCNDAGTRCINGTIQEVGIYGKHWTQDRVTQEYNDNNSRCWEVNDTNTDTEKTFEYTLSCNTTKYTTTQTEQTINTLNFDNTLKNIGLDREKHQTYYLLLELSSEDLNPYSINITTPCNKYYNSSLSYPYQENLSLNVSNCSLGQQQINATFCDGFTTERECQTTTYSWQNMGQLTLNAETSAGSTINNYTITLDGNNKGTTTNGTLYINNLTSQLYTVKIMPETTYQYKTVTINMTNTTQTYTFVLHQANTIDLTFLDEETNKKVTGTNITIELFSDENSYNFSTNTSEIQLNNISKGFYTMRWDADLYNERFYYINFTEKDYMNTTLYMINVSPVTTAIVYSATNNFIEDAYIKVLKYDVDTNSYILREIQKTNFEGETVLNLQYNDEFYKFIIDYPFGTTKKITSPTYIYNSQINFQLTLSEAMAEGFYQTMGVTTSMDYNKNTKNVRYTYTDNNNVLQKGCLRVYTLDKKNRETVYNHTCIQSSSGTILIKLQNNSDTNYKAVATLDFGEGETEINYIYQSFDEISPIENNGLGVFIIILLTLALTFTAYYSMTMAMIITPIPLLVGSFIKIIDINYSIPLAIWVLMVILAFVISKRTR